MHMGPVTQIYVIGGFNHPQIGQSAQAPTQDPNKPGNIDIFLLVRRAAAAITQRDQEDALIRFWLISGLFVGPIVLSVTWTLLVAWVQDDGPEVTGPASIPETTSEPAD